MSLDILYPITWVVGGESHTRGYITEEQREEEKKERIEEVREEKKRRERHQWRGATIATGRPQHFKTVLFLSLQ